MTRAAQEARLRDGTRVALRPIRPDDAERLHRLFHRLSEATIYHRFFTSVRHPSPAVLHYLSHVDGMDRLAVVADRDGEIIGVARCDRMDSREAEVAVVVEDAWQGRGLGRILVAHLADRARDAGIERFVATMLPENTRAIDLSASVPGVELAYTDAEMVARIPV